MAITSISRLQHRRGLKADIPANLAEAELGWCLDTRELFIGNGPGYGGNSQLLSQYSDNSNLVVNRFKTFSTQIQAAAVRTLGSKLNDIASVKDFGAKGNGVTDDAPAINAAIDELLGNSGVIGPNEVGTRVALRFPAGQYLISTPIKLYPYLSLIGEGADKTIILAANGSLACMMQTADSLGQTGSNIGLSSAVLPTQIVVSGMTISTNDEQIDLVSLDRYVSVRFESVKFIGGFTSGDGITGAHAAISLNSIGDTIVTYDSQFVSCNFLNVTYGIYSDDPILYTTVSRCVFDTLYQGIAIGTTPNFNGPSWTAASQSVFRNIDNSAIVVQSSNPGLISSADTFINCGVTDSVSPITWGGSSTLCVSMGDVFGTSLKVANSGNQNLIIDPQINNLSTVTNIAAIIGSNIVVISNTNVASSTTSGALRVAGGTSVGGNLYVGGNIVISSSPNSSVISPSNLLLSANTRVSVIRAPLKLATMTTTVRNTISASNADIIYNTTANKFQGYQNGGWINLDDGSPG